MSRFKFPNNSDLLHMLVFAASISLLRLSHSVLSSFSWSFTLVTNWSTFIMNVRTEIVHQGVIWMEQWREAAPWRVRVSKPQKEIINLNVNIFRSSSLVWPGWQWAVGCWMYRSCDHYQTQKAFSSTCSLSCCQRSSPWRPGGGKVDGRFTSTVAVWCVQACCAVCGD